MPDCFLKWLHHFTFLPSIHEGSDFPISIPGYFMSFWHSHSTRCEVVSHCYLICISLTINDAKHLFTCLLYVSFFPFMDHSLVVVKGLEQLNKDLSHAKCYAQVTKSPNDHQGANILCKSKRVFITKLELGLPPDTDAAAIGRSHEFWVTLLI